MYTWGDIINASLAKLDLDEGEAVKQNLLNRFYIYANEAMTQICSIKPDYKNATFDIKDKESTWTELRNKYNVYAEHLRPIRKPSQLSENEQKFWDEFEQYFYVGELQTMPYDFISFDDDINTRKWQDEYADTWLTECHDDDLSFKGHNKIIFWKPGEYSISYKARWITFTDNMYSGLELNIPSDVLDCIPSYIASQCYKIDDEGKSSIFRNEYEMFLARIDDTHFKQSTTIKIGGDW